MFFCLVRAISNFKLALWLTSSLALMYLRVIVKNATSNVSFRERLPWSYQFSTCAKFFKKVTLLTSWYAHVQRVRNVSFFGNFTYVLNGWSLFVISLYSNQKSNFLFRIEFNLKVNSEVVALVNWQNRTFTSFFITEIQKGSIF